MKRCLKSVFLFSVVILAFWADAPSASAVATPSLTVSPASLSFGSQALWTTSSPKIVTLKAGTNTLVTLSPIVVSGDYAQTSTCGAALAAGASCTVSVTFTPTSTGAGTGTLTIEDDAIGSPQTVPLTGVGVLQASATPSSLTFGSQAVATSGAAKSVTLKNNLPTTLSISSITASGDFSQTNICGTSVAAGGSCTVSVVFTPTATGSRTGTLTISDSANNSPQTVALTGTGLLQATVAPASLAMGSHAVATPSAAKAVTLTNNLGTALGISSIAVSGDFSQTNTCGSSVAAGGSCAVNVVFTPTATGNRTGTLTIADSANNSPQTVSIAGTGLLQATVAPTSLAFGNQAVATSSTAKTFTVTNNLSTALSVSSIVASGDYVQTNTCGTSLAAGGNCTVSVVFKPTTTGSRTGTVVVSDSANNSPQTVSLTGNGVVPVTVTPATLAFGNQGLSSTSAAKTVTVSNKQPTAVSLSSITTPGDYAQTNTCGTSLAAGATCTVSVTFTPTATGSRPGTLTITDSASNSPQTVTLSGNGTALPVISSLTVSSGVVGTSVTVKGTGFGTAATGTLTFNGVLATSTSWTTTSITASVPAGATTGKVTVTVNGGPSNGVSFTVVPTITSLSPNSGVTGTTVTIAGTGFGSSSTGNTVTFNGVAVTPTTWAIGSISVLVPAGASTGNVIVTVSGVASNIVAFTVVPNITSLSPTSGSTGTAVTIAGTGFGSTATGNSVTFNGIASATTAWTTGSISAQVPTGATAGNVVVTVNGVVSNGVAFSVVPTITSLSPTSGVAGTTVTITGTGFGSSAAGNTVTFKGIAATPATWTTTSISVSVPTGTSTGNVVVTVDGVASNSAPFTVVANGFTPTTGLMGSARYGHTATQLPNGKILIIGGRNSAGILSSAELYDPATQTFTATGSMNVPRWLHTATLLDNGQVLIVGGSNSVSQTTLSSAETYDPATGAFTLLRITLNTARVSHSATLLSTGQVLIVGGYDPSTGIVPYAELYDSRGVFYNLWNTNVPRLAHTATLLQNGQVLIAGGKTDATSTGAYNSAEIYDPATNQFTPLPATMVTSREGHAASLLNNGQVLVTGGDLPGTGTLSSAEIYDPASGTFTAVSSAMTTPRIGHLAVLLNGGKVLIAGGDTDSSGSNIALNSSETYDPTSQQFTATGNLSSARENQTVALLNDGTVFVDGGTDGSNILSTADLYLPSQLKGLTSITVAPATPSLAFGTYPRFTATGTFNDGSTQTLSSALWTSSAPGSAALSNDATGSGFAAIGTPGSTIVPGNAVVTASAAGVSGSTTATVLPPPLAYLTISPNFIRVSVGTSQQITVLGTYADTSTQDLTSASTLVSVDPAIASVTTNGIVAGLSQGSTTIQATDSTQVTSASVLVDPPALVQITVFPAAATISLGTTQQYQAIGTYSDGSTSDVTNSVQWYSNTYVVAGVNLTTGLATSASQGTATILANFGVLYGRATLTVGPPALVSIAVTPVTAGVNVGGNQQFTATGTYTDGSAQDITLSSTWSSSDSSVVGVNAAGLASVLAIGNITITATSGSISGKATLNATSPTGLDTSRYLHTATLLNTGKLLVAGGLTCQASGPCTALKSTELYDTSAGTFANTASMAIARSSVPAGSAPAVILPDGNVLIAGGFSCDDYGNCYSQDGTEIYDPVSSTFRNAGSMAARRSGQTMTLLSTGQVLIAGGQTCYSSTTCSSLNTAELYDPKTGLFISTGNMRAARFNASAVALNNGLVLIVGGFDGTSYPAQVELYDPTKGVFEGAAPALNAPRFSATATLLNNGQVLVAGGSTCNLPGCPSGIAELYDPVANAFSYTSGNMNVSRLNHTATLLTNGQVLIAGGYSSCGSSCTADTSTELFDPAAGTFTYGQILGTARAGHSSTLLPNGNVVLIGGINGGTTLASVESYQPVSLAPPGLVSIAIAPSTPSILSGQTQQFIAAGTFSDGSSQILPSAVWSSSNPTVATISNAVGTTGIARALGMGSSTITATVGSVTGSTTLTVPSILSMTLTPANPSIAVKSIQQLKLIATGVYSDGSSRDITSYVKWTTSNKAIAVVLANPQVFGVVGTVAAGTANITATLDGISARTLVTVTAAATPILPNVTGASPPSGPAGTQVTISGSGFGLNQGSGTIWLGSTLAAVVSWSDTQVVGTVAANAVSGSARVQQNSVWSNSVPFGVNTAVITGVTPTNGLAGTQVTITGSGFGIAQGGGQVWLGSSPGIVTSWTDGQVVATVATTSTTGVAQILQNGVLSNSVPFAVNTPQITSIAPNSGGPGTTVTINGSGFGTLQGSGIVWIGSTTGQLLSWGDTQITAAVAGNSVSGIVRVQQNGIWSNALAFTVPPAGGGAAVTITPSMISMVVGDTRTVQALDASGKPVIGLTWASSDPTIAVISVDDPPFITAVSPGHTTVTTGSGAVDVTVYAGSLPQGTIQWSVPGDGSGVSRILPAVPSAAGVADVFAVQGDGSVQAVTSSGSVAWTANVGFNTLIPDFQGGLVVVNQCCVSGSTIQRFDGLTGQPYPAYTFANSPQANVLVHTDGTIFAVDGGSIVGIDPATGGTKFSIPLEQSISSGNGNCGEYTPYQVSGSASVSNGIIAGDGYAYFPYSYTIAPLGANQKICYQIDPPWQPDAVTESYSSHRDTHFRVMRVGSDGSSQEISVRDGAADSSGYCINQAPYTGGAECSAGHFEDFQSGLTGGGGGGQLISNADQGVLMSWSETYGSNPPLYHLSSILNGSVGTATTASSLTPVLQAQDGSFIGTGDGGMSAFDQYGNLKWSVPNFNPQIATSDGGVIAQSDDGTTIAFDTNGSATGQMASLPTYSWKGAYQLGSIDSLAAASPNIATTFTAVPGGNFAKGSPTAFVNHTFGLFWCGNGFALQGYTALSPNPCPQGGGDDVRWGYYPGTSNIAALSDFSSAHPEWVGIILNEAMTAFRAGFAKEAISVSLAGSNNPCFLTCPFNPANVPEQEYTVYVLGDYPFPGSGQFFGNQSSLVYYFPLMEGAQEALGQPGANGVGWTDFSPPTTPWPPQDTVAFANLLRALGKAIGNGAVHEIGHHLERIKTIKSNNNQGFPYMDCGLGNLGDPNRPTPVACESNDNFVYSFYTSGGFPQYPNDPESSGAMFFYGVPGGTNGVPVQEPIHWGPSDVCWLQNYSVPGSCKQ